MQLDLTRYDHVDDPPSLRISFNVMDQSYYVHRDYSGPMQTLVRVCLLRVNERDLQMNNMARRCLQELQSRGNTLGDGVFMSRFDDNARIMLARIAQELGEHDDPTVFPTPTNPTLPDMNECRPVCLSRGNDPYLAR